MTNWNNVCRVCTSPAEYEVFEKIPAYLHANLNEFLNWQKPINIMLEETTGLKCTEDDGLPNKICAICISYLKHAVAFRDQYINNSLSLKAAQMLHQQNEKNKAGNKTNTDKDRLLVTTEDLIFSNERHSDSNLLNTNYIQEQNKVCKQLLNNNFQTAAPTQQNMEQQMRYLNLLFNKDTNAGLNSFNRRNDDADLYNDDNATGGVSDPYFDEDFQTESSSGEENYPVDKSNLFTYSEKNFEEDDIMNIEHLRDAITINIPESCKERKCRACFRRFMFEDSYSEHISTCIEYKFLEHIEENCRLLTLRRAKRISPHEFIRRMIFCIRKTCEWLRKANCSDMLLPDLLQNGNSGSTADNKSKTGMNENARKSSTASSAGAAPPRQPSSEDKSQTQYDLPKNNKNMTDLLSNLSNSDANASSKKYAEVNESNIEENIFITLNKRRSNTNTPITVENNILYEIERTQSRNSNNLPLSDLELDVDVINQSAAPPPIARAGSSDTGSGSGGSAASNALNDTTARVTFLKKLQKAANQSPQTIATSTQVETPLPDRSFIRVRKDLLDSAITESIPSPAGDTLKPIPVTPPPHAAGFSARCNPCNLFFETLAALEVHNAMNHNQPAVLPTIPPAAKSLDEVEREAEHQRIIALFEDDDD